MEKIIEILGIDWKLFSAEIINFLILLGIIWWILYKYVFKIIEERQEKIDDGLKKSEEAEKVLNEAKNEKAEIIAEAREEAKKKIEKGIELGKVKKESIIEKAKREASSFLEKAKKNGIDEKEKIINSSKDEIAKMAILGAERILKEK